MLIVVKKKHVDDDELFCMFDDLKHPLENLLFMLDLPVSGRKGQIVQKLHILHPVLRACIRDAGRQRFVCLVRHNGDEP
ncbi:hypothetical protein D1872_314470 [compost metagenome]